MERIWCETHERWEEVPHDCASTGPDWQFHGIRLTRHDDGTETLTVPWDPNGPDWPEQLRRLAATWERQQAEEEEPW